MFSCKFGCGTTFSSVQAKCNHETGKGNARCRDLRSAMDLSSAIDSPLETPQTIDTNAMGYIMDGLEKKYLNEIGNKPISEDEKYNRLWAMCGKEFPMDRTLELRRKLEDRDILIAKLEKDAYDKCVSTLTDITGLTEEYHRVIMETSFDTESYKLLDEIAFTEANLILLKEKLRISDMKASPVMGRIENYLIRGATQNDEDF
jgi:hypothetical protein